MKLKDRLQDVVSKIYNWKCIKENGKYNWNVISKNVSIVFVVIQIQECGTPCGMGNFFILLSILDCGTLCIEDWSSYEKAAY